MNNDEQESIGRLIRIETRLSKLMTHLGLNPQTGEPLHPTQQRSNDDQRQPYPTKIDRQPTPDRR